MSRSTVEKRWIHAGLDCVVLLTDMGHRCGYSRVPDGHPWCGVAYNKAAPTEPIDNSDFKVDDVGIIGAFCYGMAGDEERGEYDRTPEFQIRVHGGLTFSGELPHGLDGHWFGFDTAHADDSPAFWTLDAMVAETNRLADQLAAIGVAA